jgi:hypothetical protein
LRQLLEFLIIDSKNLECSRDRTVPVVNFVPICVVKCPDFGMTAARFPFPGDM